MGDGTTTNRSLPVDVVGLSSGVVAITTGKYHACALNQAGGVVCWGYNGAYQLGSGGAPTANTTPVQVQELTSGVAGISAGGSHTCAVLTDGRVKCWGSNGSGQIGDGTMTTRPTPVTVLGLIDAIAIAAGGSHTCVVTSGGALKRWGSNDAGQAGILPGGWTPVDVLDFTSVDVTPTPSPTPADTPVCGATATPRPPFTGTLPAAGSLSRQIANCNDDTYVRVDTEELLYAAEFVRMGARAGGTIPYTAGFLFRNMRVPRGACITSAYLILQPELRQSGTPVTVSIAGEAHGQSGDFSPRNWWAHLRPRTIARVPWTLSALVTEPAQSPDISAIIEEIVALPDWAPGNNVAILIDNAEGGQQFVNWKAFELDAGQSAASRCRTTSWRRRQPPRRSGCLRWPALTPPTLDGEVAEWQGVASTPLNLDAAVRDLGRHPDSGRPVGAAPERVVAVNAVFRGVHK